MVLGNRDDVKISTTCAQLVLWAIHGRKKVKMGAAEMEELFSAREVRHLLYRLRLGPRGFTQVLKSVATRRQPRQPRLMMSGSLTLLRRFLSVLGLKILHSGAARQVRIGEVTLTIDPRHVFSPFGTLTSTYLSANLGVNEKDLVLDLGTGCGIQAIVAAQKAARVVATDINPAALDLARENAEVNSVSSKIEFRLGDLFEPVSGERFDLIIYSPPYLEGKPRSMLERAWLDPGMSTTKAFLCEAGTHLHPGGRIRIVYSSIGHLEDLYHQTSLNGLMARLVTKRNFLVETLLVFEMTRVRRSNKNSYPSYGGA